MSELVSCWKADHLRWSLFSDDLWAASAEDIFQGVFNAPPDTVTNRPAVNEASASGTWETFSCEAKRAFNRIDFIMRAAPGEQAPVQMISNIHEQLPQFTKNIADWSTQKSEEGQKINRFAIGCGAFLPVSDVKESYLKLKELIKVISVDEKRFKDFRFQVNLPIDSKSLPGLQINRLTTWHSVGLRAGLMGTSKPMFIGEEFFCGCVLDINTDGNRSEPFSPGAITGLANELCTIGLDILSRGIE